MIKVVGKAIDIIELLARDKNAELSAGAIADALGMDHGTCSNILKTLAHRGYVQQEAPRSGYRLGYSVYKLLGIDMVEEDIVKVAREDVKRLGEKLNEVTILSVLRNDKRVVLFKTTPDRDLTVRTSQGKSVYSANTGRVILANYSPSHMEKFIIRNDLPTIEEWPEVATAANPKGELVNALTQIRQVGYSIQHGSNDIYGYAAPIFRKGHIVAGIGVYLPASRITSEQFLIDAVIGTAKEINRKLHLTEKL